MKKKKWDKKEATLKESKTLAKNLTKDIKGNKKHGKSDNNATEKKSKKYIKRQ